MYLLAKVIKEYVSRGRPSAFLEGVVERETFSPDSLGYPSGHAAVAWAITIILLAYLGRPWQIASIVLAIVVPIARMYVAAHLPLDLIGGAALGITVASAVNLVIGVPARAPTENSRAGPNTDERGDRSDQQSYDGRDHHSSSASSHCRAFAFATRSFSDTSGQDNPRPRIVSTRTRATIACMTGL